MSIAPLNTGTSTAYAKLQAYLQKAEAASTAATGTAATSSAAAGSASDSVTLSEASLQALEKSFALNAIGTSTNDPLLAGNDSNTSDSLSSLLNQAGLSDAKVSPTDASRWSIAQAEQAMLSSSDPQSQSNTNDPLSTLLSQYGKTMATKEASAVQAALARLKGTTTM
jgi:hypothetical protein